jgi:peroxiredoxin
MPNNLTGHYDAVLQISQRQINGLLATLHQNGVSDDPPLRLSHSGVVRVGDPREASVEPSPGFHKWVRNVQTAGGLRTLDQLRTQLSACAPPGASRRIDASFSELAPSMPGEGPSADTVRGRVKVSLSSPTLSAADGSMSEVTLRASVRAHYDPDPGTTRLAAPEHAVHGEVRAAFELRLGSSATGRRLSIEPSREDRKIQFTAAPGTRLSAEETARISAEVRRVVRDRFTPVPVDLPPDLPFSEFKVLGSGSSQVFALPVQLSATPGPAGHIRTVNHSFIDSSGFGVAVSKGYVDGWLAPVLESTKRAILDFKREIRVGTVFGVRVNKAVTFTLQLKSGPALAWEAGAIKLSANLKLVVRPGADVSFRFTQRFKLALDAPSQTVTLEPDGDPAVSTALPFNILHDAFEKAVRDAREQALSGGSTPVNHVVKHVFDGARQQLVRGLKVLDASASAAFTSVKITADGLVVRGEIGSAPRRAPVVQVAETDNGRAFTALGSWIPGGWIDRFHWSWREHSGKASTISTTRRSVTERHRFTLPRPIGVTGLGGISLRIEGTQMTPDGRVVEVSADGARQPGDGFGPIMVAPSWWEPVVVPAWLPDAPAGAALSDHIAGHISLQRDTPPKRGLTHNSLVFFADPRGRQPLEPLVSALTAMRRQRVSLVLVVVLPAGTLGRRVGGVEAMLRGIPDRFAGRVMLADDDAGGWTRTFGVVERPSVHLVNARREFAWGSEGHLDPQAMAAALDRHILPAPAPRSHPLRLGISGCGCQHAPDISFVDHRGQHFALHRLRGREVLLNFWQSWSTPCLNELLRLRDLQKTAGALAPFIVAFHGGRDGGVLKDLARRHGLTFSLVQDADQGFARTYGITCWPTTISIDAAGFVGHVQFGLADGAAGKNASSPQRKKTARPGTPRAR